ncbi:MAG: hypothetical protein ACRC8C_03090, partial [Mycoplasmoidaceae bacterium]
IASLSVLTVAATITAITVPVVMNANQISSDNSIKNDTVKTATIKSSPMADQILKADSEQVMITKVKEFNANKKWDEVFSFTNENDGSLTNVVKEVIFSLESNTIAVFAINYIDDVKITNGANIVKATVNIVDNFVTKAADFDNKIKDISNKLNDLLKKETTQADQKKLYDSWTTTPKEIENGLVDSFKFDTTDNWNTVVKDISVIPGSYQIGETMPPLGIQVNLNNKYITSSLDKELLKFNINVDPTMDLTIENAIDHEGKLTAATNALKGLLVGDFNAQKAIYQGWNNKTPVELENAIKDIVTFKNGATVLAWETVVKNVTLKTGAFPETPNVVIPEVTITINLNDVYNANFGEKFLTITSGDLSTSGNINVTVIKEDANHANKLAAAKEVLTKALAGKSLSEQKVIYDGWKTKTPVGFEDAIKDIVTFKNGTNDLTWGDAVTSVTLTAGAFPANPGEKIPEVTIKINLNDTLYNATVGEEFLTIPSGDLGTSNKINVTVINSNDHDAKLTNATNALKGLLVGDFNAQKVIYDGWKTKTPVELENAIKDIVTFKNGTNDLTWGAAVTSVTLTAGAFPANPGEKIPEVTIKINLNDALYNATVGEEFLTIPSGDLGTSNKINVTVTNSNDHDAKLIAASKILEEALKSKTSFSEQEKLFKSWNNQPAPNDFEKEIEGIVTFSGMTWVDAVESVQLQKSNTFPANPGDLIPSVLIKINLKSGLSPIGDLLSIPSKPLGHSSTDNPKPTTPFTDLKKFK